MRDLRQWADAFAATGGYDLDRVQAEAMTYPERYDAPDRAQIAANAARCLADLARDDRRRVEEAKAAGSEAANDLFVGAMGIDE